MKIIECPRDAMQGIKTFIPTNLKAKYVNALLKVGFDTIDFGSFVSPKAIPQMKDTGDLIDLLEMDSSSTKLLAIIANIKGAEQALIHDQIKYLGYPLSLSETFQQRNTNRSIETAMQDLNEIQNKCKVKNKKLVVYLSMGFGNPYDDPYHVDYISEYVQKLDVIEVETISLSDTIGVADVISIKNTFRSLIPQFPKIEFGAHLHATIETRVEKVKAVINSGCKRIDGAIGGHGGCPMAKDELTGNMETETILNVLSELEIDTHLDLKSLKESILISKEVFH